MKRTIFVAALCGLALSGCAPGRFAESTASFSDSISKMSDAVDTSATGIRSQEILARNEELIGKRARPVLATVCSDTRVEDGPGGMRRPGCGLVARADDVQQVAPVWQQLPETRRVLRLLSDYAKANAELTSAESREQIDAATTKAATALEAILTLAGQPLVAGAVGTGLRFGGYAFGEFHELVRYQQLRRNVAKGEEVLTAATLMLKNATTGFDSALQGYLQDRANFLSRRIDPRRPGYEAAVQLLSEIAAAKEELQRLDPDTTVKTILRAHAALADDLRNNKGQTAALFEAMSELAKLADAFQKAVAALGKGA